MKSGHMRGVTLGRLF